jgi:DNA-binding response OmpR family regulator
MNALVLVIVSDSLLRQTVTGHLDKEGVTAIGAATVSEGVSVARRAGPALVLLDRSLVDSRASAVCQELRWEGAPLIMLLASGGSSADAVAALEAGADDYVSLPCSMLELVARIVSLLRRQRALTAPAFIHLCIGALAIDRPHRQVTLNGRQVSLAPKEFEILAVLAERAGRVVSREELVRLVWSGKGSVKRQTLDVYLFSLRSKIEDEPDRPARLLTVRGVGYRLIALGGSPGPGSCACGA